MSVLHVFFFECIASREAYQHVCICGVHVWECMHMSVRVFVAYDICTYVNIYTHIGSDTHFEAKRANNSK